MVFILQLKVLVMLLLLVTVTVTAGVAAAAFTYPPQSRCVVCVLCCHLCAALLLMVLLLLHRLLSFCLLIFHSLNSKYTHCTVYSLTHIIVCDSHTHVLLCFPLSIHRCTKVWATSAKNQFERQQRAKHIKNILTLINILIISMNFLTLPLFLLNDTSSICVFVLFIDIFVFLWKLSHHRLRGPHAKPMKISCFSCYVCSECMFVWEFVCDWVNWAKTALKR